MKKKKKSLHSILQVCLRRDGISRDGGESKVQDGGSGDSGKEA